MKLQIVVFLPTRMSGLPRLKTGPTFAVKPGQSAGRKSKHAGKSSAAATPRQTPSNDETLAREAEITTLLKELSRSCINANLAPILQEIKAALFERNYPIAFSKPVRHHLTCTLKFKSLTYDKRSEISSGILRTMGPWPRPSIPRLVEHDRRNCRVVRKTMSRWTRHVRGMHRRRRR